MLIKLVVMHSSYRGSSLSRFKRLVCLILSFQIGSNLLGQALARLSSRRQSNRLSLKSAINLCYLQRNHTKQLLSGIRVLLKIQALLIHRVPLQYAVSCIESCFSLIYLDLDLNRAGLAAMLKTNLYTLGFGLTSCRLIKLWVKRICDPRFNMIRALFV